MYQLTNEKMKGKIINRLATSPFLTPALIKNAIDTAHMLTNISINQKIKNLSASTCKPVKTI